MDQCSEVGSPTSGISIIIEEDTAEKDGRSPPSRGAGRQRGGEESTEETSAWDSPAPIRTPH